MAAIVVIVAEHVSTRQLIQQYGLIQHIYVLCTCMCMYASHALEFNNYPHAHVQVGKVISL